MRIVSHYKNNQQSNFQLNDVSYFQQLSYEKALWSNFCIILWIPLMLYFKYFLSSFARISTTIICPQLFVAKVSYKESNGWMLLIKCCFSHVVKWKSQDLVSAKFHQIYKVPQVTTFIRSGLWFWSFSSPINKGLCSLQNIYFSFILLIS